MKNEKKMSRMNELTDDQMEQAAGGAVITRMQLLIYMELM